MAYKSATSIDIDRQNSLVKAIVEASLEGILVVDEKGIIVSHNQQFVDIWRIPKYKLSGLEPGTAIGADDNPILAHNVGCVKDEQGFLARILELYQNPHLDDHCEIELKDGRILDRHSTVLRNSEGHYLGRVWFFRDITPQKQTEAKLMELATQDPLTGVANRRYFFERAHQEFTRSKRQSIPLSIVEMDIDYFKQINDQYGHPAGDEVLKSLCAVSQPLLREVDTFARLGGEEFAVLLPDTDMKGATRLAERLLQSIAATNLSFEGSQFKCTISVGVATLKLEDASIDDCLLRADRAMYNAKRNGRNRVVIES